jgi:hypothetical protein
MLQMVQPPIQGVREILRNFGESPKCPREVRTGDLSRFVEEMAASAVTLQMFCAVVVNKPAEAGCLTRVRREVKEKQRHFSTGVMPDEQFG